MISLIRNDLRWALPLALVGTLVHLFAMVANYTAATFWVVPLNKYLEVSSGFHATAATLVGLWALFSDDLFRTREYLLHRHQSFRRIFWVRHAVGLGVVAVWVVLVPTLHLLGTKMLSLNAALVDESRWGLYVAQGVPAFLFYALAVFLGSTTQTVLAGVVLAIAGGGFAVAAVILALMYGPHSDLFWVLGLTLVLTPFLLSSAERNRLEGRDPDRPWLNRRLALAGTAFLLVAAVVGASTLTLGQTIARIGLLAEYPRVVDSKGTPVLAKFSVDDKQWIRVDQQHAPQEVLPEIRSVLYGPHQRAVLALPMPPLARQSVFPYESERFRGQSYRLLAIGSGINLTQGHVGQDGYLHLYRLANRRSDGAPWMKRLGKGPEGRPFSPRTRILDPWQRTTLLADPEDGGIWTYDLDGDAPGCSRIELPDGDRFVEVLALHRTQPSRVYSPMPLMVKGERGTYLWKDGRFVAATVSTLQWPDPGQPGTDSPSPQFSLIPEGPRADVVLEGSSGLRASFRVPGGEVFHHTYRPHTFWESTLAFAQRVASLLRPPLVAGPSLLASVDRARELGPALLLDRPIMMGERAVLAGNLLVSLLLAGLAFRRLGLLGAGRGRRLYWASAVLLGGATIYLCHLMIERRRAWKPMPAIPEGSPAPSAALLIQTA